MQCPVCENTKLAIAERQGIEIDYCPECRGVWLDRGELDKIIERSGADNDTDDAHEREDARPRAGRSDDRGHKRKRKSMLGELLDF